MNLTDRTTALIEAFRRVYPNAHCELVFANPLQLLVATVLSAQCTDKRVNLVTETLFARYRTAPDFAQASQEELEEAIRSTGFFRNKAKNIRALAAALVERHGGQVPSGMDALTALPGVGRKTANVVLNVAFGHPTMAVDTHIFRLGNRTGIAPGKNVRTVEDGLVKRIPPDLLRHSHHWLILHGRYICKARTPECWRCPATQWCRFRPKTPPPTRPKSAKA